MEISTFTFYVIIIAALAAFFLGLMGKWGIIEWLQVHGNGFFSKMAGCGFCLSWWSGVAVAAVLATTTGEPMLMLVPFCSTTITRYLLQ